MNLRQIKVYAMEEGFATEMRSKIKIQHMANPSRTKSHVVAKQYRQM